MNSVLVTGANGFVGNQVIKELLSAGYRVRGLVRPTSDTVNLKGVDVELVSGDLTDYESLLASCEGMEAVIHTAALYSFWAPDPEVFYETNVEGTMDLLRAASDQGVEKVVVTSTASLLADSRDGNSLPSEVDELPSAYKRTKLLAERKALEFENSRGMDLAIASPTVPIGAGDKGPTPTGRMVLEFLRRRMTGFLEMRFNLVDVEDVAVGHRKVLEEGKSGERYVLGNRNMKLSEVLRLLSAYTGISLPKFKIPYPLALVAGSVDTVLRGRLMGRKPAIPLQAVRSSRIDERLNVTSAVRELDLPQTPIVKALRKAVDWFYDHDYV